MTRDKTKRSAYDWWFRSRRTGKITLSQPANLPIKLFEGFTIVGVLLPKGGVRTLFGEVAVASLAWWAVDEVARGVNPYRRAGGATALVGLTLLVVRAIRSRTP
jgi:hypothetical protein